MTQSTGACIWFTGRSGGGKSTITRELVTLLETQGRTVTVLDVVPCLEKYWLERTSEGKLLRKAFVAAEVVRHGGLAICVTVSARRRSREAARKLIGEKSFVEVFVDTASELCGERRAARKRRRSIAKRAKGWVRGVLARVPFRPPSTDYEAPLSPDVVIDAGVQAPDESARAILQTLWDRGLIAEVNFDRRDSGRTRHMDRSHV